MTAVTKSPANTSWGYPFGVDGCVSLQDAAAMLGGISTRGVTRLAKDGLIRQGKVRRRAVICTKSIRAYLAQCES